MYEWVCDFLLTCIYAIKENGLHCTPGSFFLQHNWHQFGPECDAATNCSRPLWISCLLRIHIDVCCWPVHSYNCYHYQRPCEGTRMNEKHPPKVIWNSGGDLWLCIIYSFEKYCYPCKNSILLKNALTSYPYAFYGVLEDIYIWQNVSLDMLRNKVAQASYDCG